MTVSDAGPGVPDADLAAIFEPFFRSRNVASAPGYGLGLALTKRVIVAHGGEVAAANREGNGLRVTATLPLQAEHVLRK